MNCDGDHDGKFLAGVVLGALIGAAAGVLLAPQSGEETRKIVKQKVGTWLAKEKKIVEEKKEEVKDAAKNAIDKALG